MDSAFKTAGEKGVADGRKSGFYEQKNDVAIRQSASFQVSLAPRKKLCKEPARLPHEGIRQTSGIDSFFKQGSESRSHMWRG